MSYPNRMNRFRIRATALGICCILLAAGCGERRSQQQTAIADTNLRIGNIDVAMAAYRQALDENPGNINARLGLARCHVARNESDAALEAYEAVVAADPARAEAYIEPVELMLGLGAISGAQRLAESFAEQDSERGGLLLARVELASDNVSAAVTRLEALREQLPDSMPVLVMLSRALLDAGRAPEAEALLAEAARDDSPDALAARMALIDVYQAQGKADDLISELAALSEEHPDSIGLRLALARAHLASGGVEEAKAIAEPILREQPDSGWANFVVGCGFLAEADYANAEKCLTAAARALPGENAVRQMLDAARAQEPFPADPDTAVAATDPPATPPETPRAEVVTGWRGQWQQADLGAILRDRDRLSASGDVDGRLAVAAAALFVGGPDAAVEPAAALPEDSPLRKVVTLLNERKLDESLESAREWTEEDSFRREVQMNVLGYVLSFGGARKAALDTLSTSMQNWPDQGVALYNLARTFAGAGMPEFQVQTLRALAAKYPNSLDNQLMLYGALLESGRLEEALGQAQIAQALYPEAPRALRALALAHRRLGNLDAAIDVLQRTLVSTGGDTETRVDLIESCLDGGRLDMAAELLGQAEWPEDARLRADILGAYVAALGGDWDPANALRATRELGDWGKALRMFFVAALPQLNAEAFAELFPADSRMTDTPVLVTGAALGGSREGLNTSQASLADALSQNPDALRNFALAVSLNDLGLQTAALDQLKALDEQLGGPPSLAPLMLHAMSRAQIPGNRVAAAREYVEKHSAEPSAWLGLAVICRNEKNSEAEGEALRRAAELAPESFEALFRLSVYLDGKDTVQEARQAYDRLLELAPDNPAVKNNLAYFLLRHDGDPALALRLATEAQEVIGRQASVLHTLGLAQLRNGMLDEARENLALAVEIQPGDPTLLLDMGNILLQTGEEEAGRQHLMIALAYTERLDLDFPRRAEAEALLGLQPRPGGGIGSGGPATAL